MRSRFFILFLCLEMVRSLVLSSRRLDATMSFSTTISPSRSLRRLLSSFILPDLILRSLLSKFLAHPTSSLTLSSSSAMYWFLEISSLSFSLMMAMYSSFWSFSISLFYSSITASSSFLNSISRAISCYICCICSSLAVTSPSMPVSWLSRSRTVSVIWSRSVIVYFSCSSSSTIY